MIIALYCRNMSNTALGLLLVGIFACGSEPATEPAKTIEPEPSKTIESERPMISIQKFVEMNRLQEAIGTHNQVAVIGIFRVADTEITNQGTRSQSLVATLESVAPLSSMLMPTTQVHQYWGKKNLLQGKLYVAMLSPPTSTPDRPWSILGAALVSSKAEGRKFAMELLEWQNQTFPDTQ